MTHAEARSILGVPQVCTADDIKEAWKRYALRWHPDRHPSAEQKRAAEQFMLGQQAYHTLLIPERAGSGPRAAGSSGVDGLRTAVQVARHVAATPGMRRDLVEGLTELADIVEKMLGQR